GGGASSAGAGSGGGGASSAGAGGAAQIGCASAAIVDDMEDGNGTICPNALRGGAWFVATSSAAVTTTPTAGTSFNAYSLINDPNSQNQASAYGMRFSGSGITNTSTVQPWATLGVSVSAKGVYDASAYPGLHFWAKSNTGALFVRVNLTTTESRSTANGGTCVATSTLGCDDSFGMYFTFNDTWQQYYVNFSTMTQAGWGVSVTKNLAHVHTVEFNYVQKPYNQSVTNPSAFAFLVDDLQFN
ncbi:MAG TPA: hypothetical protein VFK05_01325, partial [Polyangiaceae bacterium]|nr:hypothetical protein [Polyangiaceae bacterium]